MTHRSRVCAILIDTSAQTHETVSRFWSGALGRELKYSAEERYASLKGDRLDCFVQRVEPGHEGVHFDIETDTVEAEVARLLALGARHADVGQGEQPWVTLADPEGNEFCVLGARRS
jgi:hypothetical protein